MKIEARNPQFRRFHEYGTLLFDLESDPAQEEPLDSPEVEAMMVGHLGRLMEENDAPGEQFVRLGLI